VKNGKNTISAKLWTT